MTRSRRLALAGVLLLGAGAVVRPAQSGATGPAVSVALGGLGGLVVDYLWLRASLQQERGEHFELQQTVRQMAVLQPRRGGLLAFQAENMAFNVSESFAASQDRWRWIQAALTLLIRDGLGRAPDEPAIARSIGWIISAAVADPAAERSADYLRYWYSEWAARFQGPAPVLAGTGLDVERMASLAQRFGVTDWRAPELHAVYWYALAVDQAGGLGRRIVLDRLLLHALWDALRRGRLLPGPDGLRRQPELRLLPGLEALFGEVIDHHPSDPSLPVARRAFRIEALLLLHFAGPPAAAPRWYRHLQAVYPDDPALRQPLERFIQEATGPTS